MLISFTKLVKASQALGEYDFEISLVFASLEKWVSNFSVANRRVWLQLFGVPLHGWEVEAFEAIGSRFGMVVKVAKEIREKSF